MVGRHGANKWQLSIFEKPTGAGQGPPGNPRGRSFQGLPPGDPAWNSPKASPSAASPWKDPQRVHPGPSTSIPSPPARTPPGASSPRPSPPWIRLASQKRILKPTQDRHKHHTTRRRPRVVFVSMLFRSRGGSAGPLVKPMLSRVHFLLHPVIY